MVDSKLLKFVVEARKRGFSDPEIRQPLLDKGWPSQEVDKAFKFLEDKMGRKLRLEISLPEDIIKIVEKRARKNIMSLEEQIEDIIRRSAINAKLKKSIGPEKIDDLLVSIFSRRRHKKKG